jgi:hypothetical protein
MSDIMIVTDLFGRDFVVISNDDGSFTSMPKSDYDELEAQRAQRALPIEGAN